MTALLHTRVVMLLSLQTTQRGSDTMTRQELELLECWCRDNNLCINVDRTTGMAVGFRRARTLPPSWRRFFFSPAFFSSFKQKRRACRVAKSVQRITGSSLPTVGDTCNSRSEKKTSCIIRESTNHAHYLFAPSPQEGGCTVSWQKPPGWGKAATWMLWDFITHGTKWLFPPTIPQPFFTVLIQFSSLLIAPYFYNL